MPPGVDVGPAEARACLRHVGTERFDHADFDIKLNPDGAGFGVWRRIVSTEHNQMRATMQARLLAGHRLGRMPGATPLREAEMRWEVAVFGMLTRKGGRLRGRSDSQSLRMGCDRICVCGAGRFPFGSRRISQTRGKGPVIIAGGPIPTGSAR